MPSRHAAPARLDRLIGSSMTHPARCVARVLTLFSWHAVGGRPPERRAAVPQLKGQLQVDRDGIMRWVNVEGADEGLPGIGKFPNTEELLEAARALPR